MRLLLISILMLVISSSSLKANQELLFPLEQNYIKIFPQQFEYQLIDKNKFTVGDVLFDAAEMAFQLIKGKTTTLLYFQWPVGFLSEGDLVIKDPSGKAIWIQKIDRKKLNSKDSKNKGKIQKRSDLASFQTTQNVDALVSQLKKLPFFRFCINREEPLTKVYLCSKDLFIIPTNRGLRIGARDSFRPESFVEINGRAVDPQGIIFLNAPKEFVSLRALLLSGATLEIDTRMKPVSFVNISEDPNDSQLIKIQASGALPARNEDDFKKLGPESWEISLPKSRPSLYLQGEGGIPLRQEFLINGPLRPSDLKITLNSIPSKISYKDNYTLNVIPSDGVSISPVDRSSKVLKEDKLYKWTLGALEKNKKNTRLLKATTESGSFYAQYEIERAPAFESVLSMSVPLWSDFYLMHWLNDRYGLHFSLHQQMQKSSPEDLSQSSISTGLLYRLKPGMNLRDLSPQIGLSLGMLTIDHTSSPYVSAKFVYQTDVPKGLMQFSDILESHLSLGLATLNTDLKLSSIYRLDLKLKTKMHDTLYYEYGFFLNQTAVLLNNIERKKQSIHIQGGIGWLF